MQHLLSFIASGIGVGCAVALCEAGAAVTLVARSKDTLDELQKQMISEGWDARTVTNILGLRAFTSQLLCEQVVGRGLRRVSYDLNEDGLFDPEYVTVFGIPFSFLPVEGEILELNEDLETSPEDVNNDPYDEGWMIKMKVSNPRDLDNLLTSDDYKKLIGE